MLAGVELGEGNAAVCVNEGLLVDAAQAFDIAHVLSVLGTKLTWMFCHYLTRRFTFILLAL
jgi:hypothetical protein